jgi:hypothetical protein
MTAARTLATALHAYLGATHGGVPADRGPHVLDSVSGTTGVILFMHTPPIRS